MKTAANELDSKKKLQAQKVAVDMETAAKERDSKKGAAAWANAQRAAEWAGEKSEKKIAENSNREKSKQSSVSTDNDTEKSKQSSVPTDNDTEKSDLSSMPAWSQPLHIHMGAGQEKKTTGQVELDSTDITALARQLIMHHEAQKLKKSYLSTLLSQGHGIENLEEVDASHGSSLQYAKQSSEKEAKEHAWQTERQAKRSVAVQKKLSQSAEGQTKKHAWSQERHTKVLLTLRLQHEDEEENELQLQRQSAEKELFGIEQESSSIAGRGIMPLGPKYSRPIEKPVQTTNTKIRTGASLLLLQEAQTTHVRSRHLVHDAVLQQLQSLSNKAKDSTAKRHSAHWMAPLLYEVQQIGPARLPTTGQQSNIGRWLQHAIQSTTKADDPQAAANMAALAIIHKLQLLG